MTKENRFDTKEWTAPVIEKIPAWVADTEDVAMKYMLNISVKINLLELV